MGNNWQRRRKFMYIVSGFCMLCIAYILYKDLNSSTAENAVTMAFFTLASIVGSYVFGAVWDDKKPLS